MHKHFRSCDGKRICPDGWASHIWFEDQVEVYKDESTGNA